jgi:hypothetical protein
MQRGFPVEYAKKVRRVAPVQADRPLLLQAWAASTLAEALD